MAEQKCCISSEKWQKNSCWRLPGEEQLVLDVAQSELWCTGSSSHLVTAPLSPHQAVSPALGHFLSATSAPEPSLLQGKHHQPLLSFPTSASQKNPGELRPGCAGEKPERTKPS